MDCYRCPGLVVVPAGGFTMGSPAQEQSRANAAGISAELTARESPQHYVRVPSFAAGRYAVSKGQFAAFVRGSGYRTEAEQGDGCHMWTGKEWKKNATSNWRNPGFMQGDDHPVVCVSWNDAQAYIQWLNRISGQSYRLLSEAEREYTARSGTQTAFWLGGNITTSDANYDGNFSYDGSLKGQYRQATVPVNSFSPNRFGLYNVHGNVWEWNEDCWHETYAAAPADGSAWTTGCNANSRMLRGGSWYDHGPAVLRSAVRLSTTPESRTFGFGFRVARDFSAEEIAVFSEEVARDKRNEQAQQARKIKEDEEASAKNEKERKRLEVFEAARRLKEEKEAAKLALEEQRKLKAEEAKLAAEEQKLAKAEAAQKLREQKEIAAALAEQERKQRQEAEITRKLEAAAARAEQERKRKEEAEIALKLKVEKEALARTEAEQKRLDAVEAARKLKEEREATIKAAQERKRIEKEEAEAARKQKEREAALAKAEQETKKLEAIELARKLKEDREVAARAEEEKKRLDAIETARKLKEAQDALARQEQAKADVLTIANYQEFRTQCELLNEGPDPKISVEMAYCTKVKKLADEALIRQKDWEEAEAARKAKEKELAARKERERQRKELEDRVKKMAKDAEIKEQIDDLKKRILQNAAAQSSALEAANNLVAKPSEKYIASIQAAIRSNITFDADSASGNPAVEIQFGLTADGVIIGASITKPSGLNSWDTAAIRALEKTERLPRDENGKLPPTPVIITMRPREGIPTASAITKDSSTERSQGDLKGLGSVQASSALEKRLEFERAALADLIKKLDLDRGAFNDADSTAKASAVEFARQTAAMEDLKRKNDLSAGKVVSDCLDCPELVFIPRGTFSMGSEYAPRPGAGISERPVHMVNIDHFLMGRAPVTNKQWKAFMGSNFSALLTPCRADDCPVVYVTWNSAKDFAQKLSEKTGKSYRLPTEAEWEYAARAGTTTTWSFGESEGLLGEFAWYTENSQNKPQPIMRKKPNSFGLFDMYGNVWQWLEDCWHFNYEGAPWNGSAWVSECSLPTRVMRGGSALSQPEELRSSSRSSGVASASFFNYGFRVARDVASEVEELVKQTEALRRASQATSDTEKNKQLKLSAFRETERKINAQRLLIERLELDIKRIAGGQIP